MPRYDYRCKTCDVTFEMSRPMAEADAPATCPQGHVGATKLLPVFATTGIISAPSPAPSAGGGGGGCCGGGCCS